MRYMPRCPSAPSLKTIAVATFWPSFSSYWTRTTAPSDSSDHLATFPWNQRDRPVVQHHPLAPYVHDPALNLVGALHGGRGHLGACSQRDPRAEDDDQYQLLHAFADDNDGYVLRWKLIGAGGQVLGASVLENSAEALSQLVERGGLGVTATHGGQFTSAAAPTHARSTCAKGNLCG